MSGVDVTHGLSQPQPALAPLADPLAGIDHQMTRAVPVCLPGDSAGEVLATMSGRGYDTAADVAVCDRYAEPRRLLGLVPLVRLLAAPGPTLVRELMDADPPVLGRGADPEQAAWRAVEHAESSLAVQDGDGFFVGLVPPGRLLGDLLSAHDQDFARLGGYLSSTASARAAVSERLGRRLWHRMPWLVLGLVGSALAAWLVGLFQSRLDDDVRLAFFIPGVVYMADAIGTQTEALVIRGLSVGAPMRTALRLEAVTGPVAGMIFGAVSFPLVWLVLGSASLALTVALALVAACSVATVVAVLLPWVMQRHGRDPAFGSGPLATVVQDLLSLLLYFLVAVLVLG